MTNRVQHLAKACRRWHAGWNHEIMKAEIAINFMISWFHILASWFHVYDFVISWFRDSWFHDFAFWFRGFMFCLKSLIFRGHVIYQARIATGVLSCFPFPWFHDFILIISWFRGFKICGFRGFVVLLRDFISWFHDFVFMISWFRGFKT